MSDTLYKSFARARLTRGGGGCKSSCYTAAFLKRAFCTRCAAATERNIVIAYFRKAGRLQSSRVFSLSPFFFIYLLDCLLLLLLQPFMQIAIRLWKLPRTKLAAARMGFSPPLFGNFLLFPLQATLIEFPCLFRIIALSVPTDRS